MGRESTSLLQYARTLREVTMKLAGKLERSKRANAGQIKQVNVVGYRHAECFAERNPKSLVFQVKLAL